MCTPIDRIDTAWHRIASVPRSVSADALLSFFTDGRPRSTRAVGAEFELLVVDRRSGKEAPFGGPRGVEAVLGRLRDGGTGWKPQEIGGRLIGLERADGSTVTLEPGSQLEISSPPRKSALEVDADLRAFVTEFRRATAGLDVALTGIGLNPFSATQEVELGPKPRYRIMTDYLSKTGDLALDMMRRTCSVHVTFDYRDEAEALAMQRVAFAVTPVVVSMFACSPLEKGVPNGFKSFRWEVWHRTDPDRCGVLPGVFDPGFSLARYVERVLDVPLIFIVRDGIYRPAHGFPARSWFAGEWQPLGMEPEIQDLEWVINQTFRDARLRKYLECRAADFPSPALATAPVALWTGLLYDEGAREGAWALMKDLDAPERARLSRAVAKEGLAARTGDRDVLSLAKDLARLAREGLVRRALGEERLLDPLDAQLATGKTPAETLLDNVGPFPADPARLIAALEL